MVLALVAYPLLARAEAPLPPAPDARFALALYCNPTCDEAVTDALEAALSAIPEANGFPESATEPQRMMGIAGAEFGIPDDAFLEQYGVDVNDPERLAKSQEVLLAWFVAPRAQALDTFATAHAAFAHAAAESAGWVEDLDTQSVYGGQAWAARDPRGPIRDWFVVDAVAASTDGTGPLRLVTRGLRRYGDFELVVPDVSAEGAPDVSFVLNAVAETLHRSAAPSASFGVASRSVRGTATLSEIAYEDNDPEPPLLRVSFQGDIAPTNPEPAAPPQAAEPVANSAPLAVPVAPTPATPSPAPARSATDAGPAPVAPARSLAEAQSQALARFGTVVRSAWDAGLPAGSTVAVSAPFETRAGTTEYIWVELREWSDQGVSGVLVNEPYDVPGLHKGDVVPVDPARIYDYIWRKPDGTREGNTTAAFLKR